MHRTDHFAGEALVNDDLSLLRPRIAAILLQAEGAQASEKAWLETELAASPAAVTAYLQHIELLSGLLYATRAELPLTASWLSGTPADRGEYKPIEMPRASVLALVDHLRTSRKGFSAARTLALAVSILLVGYFVTVFGLLLWDREHPIDMLAQHAAESNENVGALLVEARDCEWEGFVPVAGKRLATDKICLRQGLAELKFDQGATVTICGPAEFEIRTASSGFLRTGRLMARVPRPAIGFSIATPTAEIIDLGTEFGVDVDASGRTDVQVIDGAVNVNYSALENKPRSSRRSVRMTAGGAKRFSAQPENADVITATEIAPWLDQNASIRKPLGPRLNLPAETNYAATVLADRPLGYWRLSDRGADTAADASGHGNAGKYERFVSTNNPGICPSTNDRSVRFLGPAYNGAIKFTDFELPASFSIELWARSTTPEWNAEGWLFSSRGVDGVVFYADKGSRAWQFAMYDHHGGLHVIDAHRALNVADRFHHYVATYDADADQAQVYFDGVLVGTKSTMLGTEQRREATRLSFYLGRDDQDRPHIWGDGYIDELAIYGSVLTVEAIHRHFRAAAVIKASDVDILPSAPKEQ
jgi:hypothetical protein